MEGPTAAMFNRFQQIRSALSRKKIRTQLLAVYMVAGLLPILIVGGYLLFNNRDQVMQQHRELTSAYNTRAKGVILNTTILVNSLATDVFQDSSLQDILAERYSSADQMNDACRNYTKMDDIENNYMEIANIYLYCNNPTMTNYGHFLTATKEDKATAWYRTAEQNSTAHWMTWDYDNSRYGTNIVHLRYVLRIPVTRTGEFAVLVIDVNNNSLKSEIGADVPATYMSVNRNPVFFSTTSELLGQRMPTQIDYTSDYLRDLEVKEFNGKSDLLEASVLKTVGSNDKIYIVTVDSEALPQVNSILITCLIIVLFSLFVPLVLIVYFSKAFSGRVITLKREMHKVGMGNYDIIETFNGSDELMDLFVEMKTMIENIKSRDREIYQDKITKQQLVNRQQEMEFKMLSSQINPHFLYNTLESIRMKAYLNGDTEVAYAVKLLGKTMRHVLESGSSTVSLRSELTHVKNYLEIMKIRFKDKLNYDFSGTEQIDCENYKMLPLLLQPIVENAVSHGLEEKEHGGKVQISIGTNPAEGLLFVTVADNGCGIRREQLDELRKTIDSGQDAVTKGIGLQNVHKRLKMFYGERYGLKIESEQGAGTTVTIVLPLRWEETKQ